jgi:hypothetical protein
MASRRWPAALNRLAADGLIFDPMLKLSNPFWRTGI